MLEIYEKELDLAESIYEVGCGRGANLILYRNRGKRVGGVDYSKRFVMTAQKLMHGCDIEIGGSVGYGN